jgi:SpoVK/Ycf46/Vps4 family AAA+-type ATPase
MKHATTLINRLLICSPAPSLLFATTNHIERLDPALSRPGRMDVWVNFANATKWQAKGIFKCFFPYKVASDTAESEPALAVPTEKNLPLPRRKSAAHNIPLLSEEELNDLAERFSAAIPEDELSASPLRPGLRRPVTEPFCRLQVCKVTSSRTRLGRASASTRSPSGSSRNVRPGRS